MVRTAVALALLFLAVAHAFPAYRAEIPNLPMVNGVQVQGVGHVKPTGGGRRNQFGKDFEEAGFKWTAELCRKDSDGDGISNGEELGDVNCKWKKGDPKPMRAGYTISHPGVATSVPQRI